MRALVQTSSAIGFETLYAGYRWDGATPQMYYVRNRFLLPMIGTWNQRDPLGYVDGMNLFPYVRRNGLVETDSSGEATQKHHWFPRLRGRGYAYAKKLCGDKGIPLNIDDFTTPLETNPGPHSWLHNNHYYHKTGEGIYKNSKTCCEMMTKMLALMGTSWKALQTLYHDLPPQPPA